MERPAMKTVLQESALLLLTAFMAACSSADKIDNAETPDPKALAGRVPTIRFIDFVWDGGSHSFFFPNADGAYTSVRLDTRTKINVPKVRYVEVGRSDSLMPGKGEVKMIHRFAPGEYEKIVPVIKDVYITDYALNQLFDMLIKSEDFDADCAAMTAWVINNYSPKDADFIKRLSAAPPGESKRMAKEWKEEAFSNKGDCSGKIIRGWDQQMLVEYLMEAWEAMRDKN